MTTKIIITSPNRRTYANLRNGLLAAIMIITGILRKDIFKNPSNEVGYVVLSVYLVLISLSIVLFYLSRRKQVVGHLVMNKDEILIQSGNSEHVYCIKDLSAFTIRKPFWDEKLSFNGLWYIYDNWLIITYNNKISEYQFIVDSIFANKQLVDLIDIWKNLAHFTLERGNK